MHILLILLAFFLAFPSGYAFNDIPSSSSYYNAVTYLGNQGIITTTNANFNPDIILNRAELAKVALISGDIPIEKATSRPFSDMTDPNDWAYDVAYTAKKNGVMQGYANGTFGARNPVTYIEAFKIILNARYKGNIPVATQSNYSDISLSDWWAPFVQMALDKNLISGPSGNTFGIKNLFPRKYMAQMIYRDILVQTQNASNFSSTLEASINEQNQLDTLNGVGENLDDFNDLDFDINFDLTF